MPKEQNERSIKILGTAHNKGEKTQLSVRILGDHYLINQFQPCTQEDSDLEMTIRN